MGVSLPESISCIDENTFYGCASMTSLHLPEGVTTIGNGAFCASAIKTINLPQGLLSIGDEAFSGTQVTNIVVPDGVSMLGESVFANCFYLQSIKIPEGVTYIGSNAFSNCFALTAITLPKALETIGAYAFMDCSSLRKLVMPASLTTIGEDALQGCMGLKYIIMHTMTPPSLLSWNVLQNTNECPIYVYEESYEDYIFNWKWADYSDRIVPMRKDALPGDVNGDGSVNVTDVITIVNFILDRDLDNFLPYLADVNDDDEVNISDAIAINRRLLGESGR